MKTLLVLNASGRVTRSITRRLTKRFAESWRAWNPDGTILQRDLGLNPPPPVNERWIAAAFADSAQRSLEMNEALRVSETLIEEIERADTVLLGTPIYNFGMPAQLKAWFDQIVRVGRTFEMVPGDAEPYRPPNEFRSPSAVNFAKKIARRRPVNLPPFVISLSWTNRRNH
jgi:FMN-dependent NADH-azoreductase